MTREQRVVKQVVMGESESQAAELEPLYFSERGAGFFVRQLNDMAERCVAFKNGAPVKNKPDHPFRLDVDRIRKASAISDAGEPLGAIIEQFDNAVLSQSLNFGSPAFLAHPDNGASIAAVVGDFARAMMHQNMVSYEYSPAATYAEYELLLQIRKLIGYDMGATEPSNSGAKPGFFDSYVFGQASGGGNAPLEVGEAGGAFVFGGTGANLSGLLAARESLKQKLQRAGEIYDPRRACVLTKVPFAHYSLRRAITLLGLGNSDLTSQQLADLGVDADPRVNVESSSFRMDLLDLERKINRTLERGRQILAIFALAGDSRMMSFDDLEKIAVLGEKYKIWVHADACEGGQCLFGRESRARLRGIERVNSVSIDPHKTLLLPYSLSAFFLRDKKDMQLIDANTSLIRLGSSSLGTYTPNVGSKDFASLRLWFMLKHWGWARLADEIDRRHRLALTAAQKINELPSFKLINPGVEHNAVAFTYCPSDFFRSGGSVDSLNARNKEIHYRLNCESEFYIHMMMSRDDDDVLARGKADITILRMMFGNPNTTEDIVFRCLSRIDAIGKDVFSR